MNSRFELRGILITALLAFAMTALLVLIAMAAAGPAHAAEADSTDSARHTLRFGEFAFDPLRETPSLPTGWGSSAATGPDLHLVQFDGAISGDVQDRLQAAGLEIVRYVHPDTYIVWGRRADRDALPGRASHGGTQGGTTIRWTGDFAPAYRVPAGWRDRPGELLDMRVLIYRGAGAEAVVEALTRIGTLVGQRTVIDETFEIVGFRIPGGLMRFAASVPGVYSIQPLESDWQVRAELSSQINADNLDDDGYAVPGYNAWLSGVGLNGNGVTVAIVDEGVDETHPDLVAGHLPCTGPSCTTAPSSHGTHVAGIVAGTGASGVQDGNGFLRGLGVAPSAKYIEQEFVMFRFLPGGVSALIADSRQNGATISNNSWGTSSSAKGYNADSLMVDAGVRDADPVLPGNQPLLYVQAIGNGNGGVSSQGAPEEAKNSIVVGSTPAADLDGSQESDIDRISDNSAHGPALDGRTIPHIVAPGCSVDSTAPDFGEGHGHMLMCGTSMATPQVSGAAALFTQYYRGLPGSPGDPSPALVKAAFLAVAHDLSGHADADGTLMGHRPNTKQGWGRMDLRAAVAPPAGSVLYFDQARVFEETGENWIRDVVPVNPSQPMRIFLTWTDAPGHGLGGTTPAWNNDLNLAVDADGTTYLGNVFGATGWSAPGGTADPKNNAEGVMFSVPPAAATIRVVAANINSDGVPNSGDKLDQDFAFVCYNCAYAPGFDLDPVPVTRDICAPGPATYTVKVLGHAGYTSPVTLSLTGVPAGASAGFSVNPVAPGGQSVLTVQPGSIADGNYALTLTGSAPGKTRTQPLYLRHRTGLPAPPAPSSPANGATGVSSLPTLQWSAVPWADSYVVELSTSPSFATLFYTGYSESTTHKPTEILAENTLYYWRVRARNACGFGTISPVWSFTTRNVPEVLLVDDDWDIHGDYQPDYRAAMNALPLAPWNYPVTYDVWDVYAGMQQKEPDYPSLALYKKVIWWSGREDFYPGPTDFSEQELGRWFDRRGGCFLLSSADYVYARGGVSSFMTQRLGVGSVVQDAAKAQVTGQPPVFGDLGTITLKNISPDYSDTVSPNGTAQLAFAGNNGNAGVDRNGSWYRTAFAGFGLERLFTATDRQKALLRFLQWCDGLAAVDGDGDGVANAADCVPGDAGAWTAPSPVTNLMISKVEPGFTWSQPVSGAGSVYDLLRSSSPGDFWNASCVATGVSQTSVPASWDTVTPLPGQAFFYLVRARGACGTAAMGTSSSGTPRQGTACH